MVVEPVGLVMGKVRAAEQVKVLVRKAEATAEEMELGMAVAVSS